MGVPRLWRETRPWNRIDELVVLDIADNKPNNKWQTKSIPSGGDTLEVRFVDSWLHYRITDSNDDDFLEVGSYPPWMVVSAKVTTNL